MDKNDESASLQFSSCGCRFENEHSNTVILCEECSELPSHSKIDTSEVVDMLLRYTEDGPISEWADRIADVARDIELPLCNIEWTGSPKHVATNLVVYSFRNYSGHEKLIEYLQV